MIDITVILAAIGGLTGLISIFTTYSKLQNVLARLESRDLELKEQIKQLELRSEYGSDHIELLVNGLKERVEHINTRLSNQYKDINSVLSDIEGFLQKKTEYERRSRP